MQDKGSSLDPWCPILAVDGLVTPGRHTLLSLLGKCWTCDCPNDCHSSWDTALSRNPPTVIGVSSKESSCCFSTNMWKVSCSNYVSSRAWVDPRETVAFQNLLVPLQSGTLQSPNLLHWSSWSSCFFSFCWFCFEFLYRGIILNSLMLMLL